MRPASTGADVSTVHHIANAWDDQAYARTGNGIGDVTSRGFSCATAASSTDVSAWYSRTLGQYRASRSQR
eukprot:466842-Rhodomonas_salina.3